METRKEPAPLRTKPAPLLPAQTNKIPTARHRAAAWKRDRKTWACLRLLFRRIRIPRVSLTGRCQLKIGADAHSLAFAKDFQLGISPSLGDGGAKTGRIRHRLSGQRHNQV